MPESSQTTFTVHVMHSSILRYHAGCRGARDTTEPHLPLRKRTDSIFGRAKARVRTESNLVLAALGMSPLKDDQYEALLDGKDIVGFGVVDLDGIGTAHGKILAPKTYFSAMRHNATEEEPQAIEVLVPMTFVLPYRSLWVGRVQKLMKLLSAREGISLPEEIASTSAFAGPHRTVAMRIEHGMSLTAIWSPVGAASMRHENPATLLVKTVGIRSIGLFRTPVDRYSILFNQHPRDIVWAIAGKSIDMLPEETPDQWNQERDQEKLARIALSILSNEIER